MISRLQTLLRTYLPVIALLTCTPFAAHATVISYQIGGYGYGGYSASWIHTADSCTAGASDLDIGDSQLCMSGDFKLPITGKIVGSWDNGSFNVTGGNLGWSVSILEGNLGGDYYDGSGNPLWYLDVLISGLLTTTFYFEDLSEFFGGNPKYPNQADEKRIILWGQNMDAYLGCSDSDKKRGSCVPLGLDIYARVPEPGTLGLLSLGLFAAGMVRRRRRDVVAAK